MGFFDDMTDALVSYPVASVKLELVDQVVPGNVLNAGETAQFRVKVTNEGALNLTGVTLLIKGLNGAQVANNGAAAPFVNEFVTQQLPTIRGHNGSQITVGSPLKFRAPPGAQASRDLVKVTLQSWNANLDHILLDHSDPLEDRPSAIHASAVVAL